MQNKEELKILNQLQRATKTLKIIQQQIEILNINCIRSENLQGKKTLIFSFEGNIQTDNYEDLRTYLMLLKNREVWEAEILRLKQKLGIS